MIERKAYVLVDGQGNRLAAGTEQAMEAAAIERAEQTHGGAFVERVPEEPGGLAKNPVDPSMAAKTTIEFAVKAYQNTGLDLVCLALYGQSYLTLELVESIPLRQALQRLRPYLPGSTKYDSLDCVGGGALDLSAAEDAKAEAFAEQYAEYDEDDDGRIIEWRVYRSKPVAGASYDSYPQESAAREAALALGAGATVKRGLVPKPRDPMANSYGMLARNAKLAKGKSPDGRLSIAYGLSLAPHQIGLRGLGRATPGGFTVTEDDLSQKNMARVVSAVVRPDLEAFAMLPVLATQTQAAVWKDLLEQATRRSFTACPGASAACMESCLVHSGQNAASVEALVSKLGLTRALYADPAAFCRLLLENLRRFFTEAAACKPADLFCRLNVFSDIPWEQLFPDLIDPIKRVALRAPDGNGPSKYKPGDWESRPLTGSGSFYDYTKVSMRMQWLARHVAMTHNIDEATALARCQDYYHLTFSYSGSNLALAADWLLRGGKVACVYVLERTERDWLDREVTMGPPSPQISKQLVEARFPWVPRDESGLVAAIWDWASTGKEPSPQSALGKLFKNQSFPPPVRNPRRNPLPPGRLQQERLEYAAEWISRRLAGSLPPGVTLDAGDLWLPVSPDARAHLRSRVKSAFYGDVIKYPEDHPFHGYPIINADNNDLRAKDRHLVAGPAIVGLDYKVAKVRIAVDKWVAFEGASKGDQAGIEFDSEAAVREYVAAHPGTNYRRKGELFYQRLDLKKNSLATPVRAVAQKGGGFIYQAPQIPRQTRKGGQDDAA